MDHANRAKLIDAPERRVLAQPLECREDADTGQLVMEGYAATWEPYDCYGGPDRGGWVEQLKRSAFQRTLSEQPDVMLLINHEGLPIARTKSGNLDLTADDHGLYVRAELDKSDPDVQRIAPKMKPRPGNNRPMLDEMSFSFRVKNQQWNNDYTNRTITELSLQKGDVSVVNYGMNPGTRAVMSADAVGALARAGTQDLMELRRMDRTTLASAMRMLHRAWRANEEEDCEPGDDEHDHPQRQGAKNFGGKQAKPFKKGDGADKPDDDNDDDERAGTWVAFDGSHLLHAGVCITCANDRAKKPYGAVKYADPGYLGPDGKPAHDGNGVARYPIDAEHVKAAWSYINMPKNQKGYTAEQLSAIKARIKSAMKEHGHDVSDDKKSQPPPTISEISHIEAVRKLGGGVTLVAVLADGTRTPLPSFKQSGEYYSSPAPSTGRRRTTDNSVGSGGGQPLSPYAWDPPDNLVTADPHDDPYLKQDLGSLDPGEFGGPAPTPSPMVGSGFRGLTGADPTGTDTDLDDDIDDTDTLDDPDDNPDDDDYDKGEKDADTDDHEHGQCDEPISLSVDRRLAELRKQAELPDMPTVDEAFAYLKAL